MVWYGLIWSDMVWYGLIWSDMVWYGLIWDRRWASNPEGPTKPSVTPVVPCAMHDWRKRTRKLDWPSSFLHVLYGLHSLLPGHRNRKKQEKNRTTEVQHFRSQGFNVRANNRNKGNSYNMLQHATTCYNCRLYAKRQSRQLAKLRGWGAQSKLNVNWTLCN